MKLLASFGAIVIFNIGFGLYSIHSLAVMNSRVVESNEWAAAIAQAAEIHMYASSARRLDLNYEQADNAEQRKGIFENRTLFVEKLVALLRAYKEEVMALPYDSEELRELDIQKIDEIAGNWNAYDTISRSLTEAVDAGRKEKVDENLNASFQDIVSLARGVESSSRQIADSSMSVETATQEQAATTHEISDASNQLARIAQEMLNSIQQFTI